jgi:hypothetical protein
VLQFARQERMVVLPELKLRQAQKLDDQNFAEIGKNMAFSSSTTFNYFVFFRICF